MRLHRFVFAVVCLGWSWGWFLSSTVCGPGGGFLLYSLSSGCATTFATSSKATKEGYVRRYGNLLHCYIKVSKVLQRAMEGYAGLFNGQYRALGLCMDLQRDM